MQLVRLSASTAAGDDTMHSRASAGRRPPLPALAHPSTITVAVPLSPAEAFGEGAAPVRAGEWLPSSGSEAPPAPWVQMPSVLRSVRAQLLGQPQPEADWPPSSSLAPSPAKFRGVLPSSQQASQQSKTAAAEAQQDATHSLPLPAASRPALPRVASTAKDATVSLPLPAAAPRPPLHSVRRRTGAAAASHEQLPLMGADSGASAQAASGSPVNETEAAAAQSPGPQGTAAPLARRSVGAPTGAQTLSKAAAAALGEQLWRQLQVQRYFGGDAAAMETLVEGAQLAGAGCGGSWGRGSTLAAACGLDCCVWLE